MLVLGQEPSNLWFHKNLKKHTYKQPTNFLYYRKHQKIKINVLVHWVAEYKVVHGDAMHLSGGEVGKPTQRK